LRGVRALPVRR